MISAGGNEVTKTSFELQAGSPDDAAVALGSYLQFKFTHAADIRRTRVAFAECRNCALIWVD
jgi:hypothetical protein